MLRRRRIAGRGTRCPARKRRSTRRDQVRGRIRPSIRAPTQRAPQTNASARREGSTHALDTLPSSGERRRSALAAAADGDDGAVVGGRVVAGHRATLERWVGTARVGNVCWVASGHSESSVAHEVGVHWLDSAWQASSQPSNAPTSSEELHVPVGLPGHRGAKTPTEPGPWIACRAVSRSVPGPLVVAYAGRSRARCPSVAEARGLARRAPRGRSARRGVGPYSPYHARTRRSSVISWGAPTRTGGPQ